MAILGITTVSPGLVEVNPSVIYIDTTDTYTEVTAPGYLTPSRFQGFVFHDKQMALISTSDAGLAWMEVHLSDNGLQVNLKPAINPGTVITPTTANHISVFVNNEGTMTQDASTAINAGNIQAGVDATAGKFTSYPTTTTSGSLTLKAIDNSGDYDLTIQNDSHGQATTLTIPDGGSALSSFILSNSTGTQTIGSGNLEVSAGDFVVSNQDSRTNSVDRPVTFASITSGIPAAGIGTGILIQAESQDENPSNFGAIDFVSDDISTGSEDTRMRISTRVAGAALAPAYDFVSTGSSGMVLTHAATGTRTLTLPNYDLAIADLSWQKIQEQDATNSAFIEFKNLSSTFRAYKIIVSGLSAQTGGSDLYMTFSADNGASYAAIGYYYAEDEVSLTLGFVNNSTNNDSKFLLSKIVSATAGETMCGEISFLNPLVAGSNITWSLGGIDNNHDAKRADGAGNLLLIAGNAFKFAMSADSIATGKFTLYGLRA